MNKTLTPEIKGKKLLKPVIAEPQNESHNLRELAFENTAQPNIIVEVKTGKIILANSAACNLLGYSEEELLSKKRADLFEEAEPGLKKMLSKRKEKGQATAKVNAIGKSGKSFPCEINSATFKDEHGVQTSVTAINDLRDSIASQKKIDVKNKKVTDKDMLSALSESNVALEQNAQWLKYFAETSYDVMWDWNILSGKIYVGNSIEDVFGYNIKGDTIDYRILLKYLLPADRDTFSTKINKSLLSKKRSWEDSFFIRRKDSEMASTTSRACIIRDAKGVAVRLVGATQDVSRLLLLEEELQLKDALHKEDSEKFRLTAKLSFDVIWDWDLVSNEVFIGEGFKDLFGYTIRKNKGNMTRDWVNYIHPDEKQMIKDKLAETIKSKAMSWKHAYRIIRADGSIAKVYVRASIMRDTAGRAYRMIGAVQDLSRQKDLEEQLDKQIEDNSYLISTYQENFGLIFNSSSEILYDVNLVSNMVILSDAYAKEFGYTLVDNTLSGDEWMSHIHPDDKMVFLADHERMLNTREIEWKYSFRYFKNDNSIAHIHGNSVVLRHPDGVAYRIIGNMQDKEKKKKIEEKLSMEIDARERVMVNTIEEARDAVRSEIGRELHDNINQLLGASKLYLEMAKKGGKNSKMYLSRSSEYTLSAIDEIRKLTKGLTTDTLSILGLCGSIECMADDLMEVNPLKIKLHLNTAIERLLGNKIKLNIYRIVQELLNNIIKHANATTVVITFEQEKSLVFLTVTDNGKGFDISKTHQGIGLNNITERVKDINGELKTNSEPGKGCTSTITLKIDGDAKD